MDILEVTSLTVEQLKYLHEVTISFVPHRMTSIMGPNCSGKTTVLHALACCFQPFANGAKTLGENYRFSSFFVPSTIGSWAGNKFSMTYKNVTAPGMNFLSQEYKKTSDRWSPKYERRPVRPVFIVNIETCVPRIERETKETLITFSEQPSTHSKKQKIVLGLSQVMGRDYSELLSYTAPRRSHIGVNFGGLKYSDLTMGAGEQRIYRILDIVHSAPKGSLILVDEIDLLLHKDSLFRLIEYLIKVADDQSLQIIFTSHNQEVLAFEGQINIRHMFNVEARSFCLNETSHEAILRLTGGIPESDKYEIYVEDEFSKAIVLYIALELGIKKSIKIYKFGPAINGITTAAGMALRDRHLNKKYFVLDGDVVNLDDQKRSQIEKVLTGDVPEMLRLRDLVQSRLFQYSPQANEPPEKVVTDMLRDLDGSDEITSVIRATGFEADKHKYIKKLCEALGMEEPTLANNLIRIVKQHENWARYVEAVRRICVEIKADIG